MEIKTKKTSRGVEVTLIQKFRIELDENVREGVNSYTEFNNLTEEQTKVIRINPKKVFVLKELEGD